MLHKFLNKFDCEDAYKRQRDHGISDNADNDMANEFWKEVADIMGYKLCGFTGFFRARFVRNNYYQSTLNLEYEDGKRIIEIYYADSETFFKR